MSSTASDRPEPVPATTVAIDRPAALAAALRAALVAAGRPRDHGGRFATVAFTAEDDGLGCAATDSYRLHLTRLGLADDAKAALAPVLAGGFTTTVTAAASLADLAAGRGCPPVTLSRTDGATVTATAGDRSVVLPRSPFEFPHLAAIDLTAACAAVPVLVDHRFLAGVARAAAAVDRHAVVSIDSLAPAGQVVWRAENPTLGVRLCAVVAAVRPPLEHRPPPKPRPPHRLPRPRPTP